MVPRASLQWGRRDSLRREVMATPREDGRDEQERGWSTLASLDKRLDDRPLSLYKNGADGTPRLSRMGGEDASRKREEVKGTNKRDDGTPLPL